MRYTSQVYTLSYYPDKVDNQTFQNEKEKLYNNNADTILSINK